jgi:hypothetical protein
LEGLSRGVESGGYYDGSLAADRQHDCVFNAALSRELRVTNVLNCLKAMALGALCGAVLWGLVLVSMQPDERIYATIVPEDNEKDQWKGETLALCQGKNRVDDGISFCEKAPMAVASQKGQ